MNHTWLSELIAAPPGFSLEGDDKYMYAFHAAVDAATGTLRSFAHTNWDGFVADYRTYLPSGRASVLTLNLLAFLMMSLK